jgi:uncharacterized membrane protein YedE/YeeE
VKILRSVILSLLVGAVAFLAAFIITVNVYATWHAFARQPTGRTAAIDCGLLLATIVGAAAFCATLYLIHFRKRSTANP